MQKIASLPAVHAQDLGAHPAPAPNCTVLSSVDGGRSRGGTAGGGKSPADPAAQEELFVDESGTSAVWRSLGGQIVHTSFRSVVLGPSSVRNVHGGSDASSNCHGSIVQAVRCRFPVLLEGWSSKQDRKGGAQSDNHHQQQQQQWQRQKRRRRGPWSICILRCPDLVTVHHPSGYSYDVTLPCEARLLQPLGEGLLVQRFSGEADTAVQGGEEEVPSLFTLRHPLDELRPVALLPPTTMLGGSSSSSSSAMLPPPLPAEDQQQRLVCDASERVVFARGGGAGGVGRDVSLLLTYHAERRRHSLWLVLPAPEPEPEPELLPEPEGPLLAATHGGDGGGGDVSVLGALVDQSPGGFDGWRATTTGLSSTFAGDASSLSSTLLGVSALDSSSSAAGLSMIDAVLAAGHPRKERLSVGGSTRAGSAGRGRLSFGASGRRTSTGSNTSWIGAASTRNDALATALGLGKSALGVASNMLSLSAAAGQGGGGGGERAPGTDPFLPTLAAGGGSVAGTMGFGDSQAFEDDEDDDEDEGVSQAIRPHLGLSLVWREAEDSPTPAQHVFCAATGTAERGVAARSAGDEIVGSPSTEPFLLCLVEQDTARLRALSVSFAAANTGGCDKARGVVVSEAFTMPCRSAVGLCATTGGEGEGTPGGAIAADILVLAPDGGLVLCRGEHPVTRVEIPPQAGEPAPAPASATGGSDQLESVSEAMGSCFTLTRRGGDRRRLRLSLDPASPLVTTCLGAWDCLLSSPLASSLRADVVCTAHALAGQEGRVDAGVGSGVSGYRQRGEGSVGEDLEWAGLVSVLRSLVTGVESDTAGEQKGRQGDSHGGLEPSKVCKPGGGGGGGGDDGDDDDIAWTSLLSSPFHDQFSRDNVMLLSGLDLDREGVRKGEGSLGRRRSTQSATSTAAAAAAAAAVSRKSSPPAIQTQRGAFLAEVGAAFDALHLVLEDLKTSRLTSALVPRLASLLLSLTRLCGDAGSDMRDFADHYWRDAAGCGGGDGEAESMIVRGDGGQRGVTMGGGFLPSRPTRFRNVRGM